MESVKITIEVDRDTSNKLKQFVPWGVQGKLLSKVITDTVRVLERSPNKNLLIGALMTGDIRITEVSKDLKTLEKDG